MKSIHYPSEVKARQKLTIMRKLTGTAWGTDGQKLKTSYQGTVRPKREYSSPAEATTTKGNLLSLDKVQKPGTTHYHRSHEVHHEGTPISSQISMSAYRTIT